MGQPTDKPPVTKDASSADSFMVVLETLGDTTWRMFVPSVGFTLLGVWLDSIWDTKPWLMALGILLGVFGAYLLVSKQYEQIKRSNTR